MILILMKTMHNQLHCSSKYYDIPELSKFNSSKNKYFSLSHINTRRILINFFHFFFAAGICLDLLGITETKEQVGKGFTTKKMLILMSI